MSSPTRLLLLAALLAALGACADVTVGGAPAGSCRQDRDCPGGQICADGACEAQVCLSDQDCPFSYECLQGVCAAIEGYCNRNGDCLNGTLCDRATMRCVPPDQISRPCTSNDQCFSDELCDADGFCALPDAPIPDAGPDLPPEDLSEPEITPDFSPEDLPTDTDPDEVEPDLSVPDLIDEEITPDLPPEDVPEPDLTPDLPPDLPPEDVPEPDLEPDLPPEDLPEPDIAPDLPPEDVPEPDLEPDLPPEDVPEPDLEPDLPPEDVPEPDLEPDLPPEDMEMDAAPDVFEPPPTPRPGFYEFARLEIGGLEAMQTVAFHPAGEFAVAMEVYSDIHLVRWADSATIRLTPTPTSGYVYSFQDVVFDPSGQFALIVGFEQRCTQQPRVCTYVGVILRLDFGGWIAGGEPELTPTLTRLNVTLDPVYDILYPWDGGLPVVLTSREINGGSYIASLRDLDPVAGTLGSFAAATNSGFGECRHMAYTTNEFGRRGLFLSCNSNRWYYTIIGGIGEWRTGQELGTTELFDTFGAAEHRPGDYALFMTGSSNGNHIRRFKDGRITDENLIIQGYRPSFPAFQQEGQRALLIGGSGGSMLEYRHDLFTGCSADPFRCLTDASIGGFSAPPFSAPDPTYISGAAWKPGCDGGYLVTSHSNSNPSRGMIIEFSIVGGRPCR